MCRDHRRLQETLQALEVPFNYGPEGAIVWIGSQRFFQVNPGFFRLTIANELLGPTLVRDRLPLGNFWVVGNSLG